jgi:soluble lytic murein transglycosylase
MQIIPTTGKAISSDLNIAEYSLHEPSISIKFGSYYFKNRVADFNSIPLALAAYNAGPVRVRKWVEKNPNAEMDEFIELIPYDETRDYVKYVLARQVIYAILLEGMVQ